MVKIMIILIVGSLCGENDNLKNSKDKIEDIVVDAFYQALDRILSEDSQYKYNVNVDKIQFIKKSLGFISQLGKENISVLKILELFPSAREIELTEEFLCLGFFIQFYRFIFYDTCSFNSTEFLKYKYRTEDIRKCEAVDYVFDRLNGRIGLFTTFSPSQFIKEDSKYWNLSDVKIDDKMSNFFDKFALRDNCFIIENKNKKNDQCSLNNVDDILEDCDYVDMGNSNYSMKEDSFKDTNNLSRYLILSNSFVSHDFLKDEDLKDRKEIAQKPFKLIKTEDQLIFQLWDIDFCVKLVFQIFEMLAFYTNESIIIDLVLDKGKISIQYKIESDFLKLPSIEGEYKHLYTLILLNQISHCKLEGIRIIYDKHKSISDDIINKCKMKMKSFYKKTNKWWFLRTKKEQESLHELTKLATKNIPEASQCRTLSLENCSCGCNEDLSNFYNTNEAQKKISDKTLYKMVESLYWSLDVVLGFPQEISSIILEGLEILYSFRENDSTTQDVVNEYCLISFYYNIDIIHYLIEHYTKRYVEALRDVQVHLKELTKETTCNEKANVFRKQLEKISKLKKSSEIIELKLLLSLIHKVDVTYEFVVMETCLILKGCEFEPKIRDIDKEKYIINNIRLNQLKYALLTQLCLNKAVLLMKNLI